MRVTIRASGGHVVAENGEPRVVRMPAVSTRSLCAQAGQAWHRLVKDLSPEQWEASAALTQESAVIVRGVVKPDARQVGGQDLAGRHLLRANPRGKLNCGQRAQIIAGRARVFRHRLQHTAHGRCRDRLSEGSATDRSVAHQVVSSANRTAYAIGPMTKIVLPNGSMTSKVLAPHDSFLGGLLMATRSRHSW